MGRTIITENDVSKAREALGRSRQRYLLDPYELLPGWDEEEEEPEEEPGREEPEEVEEGLRAERQDAIRRYREGVESAWVDSNLQDHEVERLTALGDALGLNPSAAADVEREVMGETKEAIRERQEQAPRERERPDRLDQLYARARRSHQNHEWQAVIDIFEQIRAEGPAYPDPEGLLSSANEALQRARSAAIEEERYDATDAAKQKAQELGVDLSQIKGTGPGGRITVQEVMLAKKGSFRKEESPRRRKRREEDLQKARSVAIERREEELTRAALSQRVDAYTDRLLKYLPAESVALYLTLQGIVVSSVEAPALNAWLWFAFAIGIIGTPLYLWRIQQVSKTMQLGVSTAAFGVWVFALGGAFASMSWYEPFIGSLALVVFTFFAPLINPDVSRSEEAS